MNLQTIIVTVTCVVIVSGAHVVQAAEKSRGHCVKYDQCETDDGGAIDCALESAPKKLEAEVLKDLKEYCSEVVDTYGDHLCCSEAQVGEITSNFGLLSGVLGRCPACFNNLKRSFCEMTCSPLQYQFVNVTKTVKNTKGQDLVNEMRVYVKSSYAQATFDSCRNVLMPSTNGPAMEFLCGPWGSYKCNPHRWFNYMGSTSNGYAPYDITFNFIEDENDVTDTFTIGFQDTDGNVVETQEVPITIFHPMVYKCSEVVPNTTNKACSCIDCEASCPAAPAPPIPEEPWTIIGYDAMYVLMTAVFGLAVIAILLLACGEPGANEKEDPVDYKLSIIERMGAAWDKAVRDFFTFLGTKCAENPAIVLTLGLLLVGGLSSGLRHLKVTTDPVELWAGPTSQSKQDKEYFDSHFEPFYRTQQVIVTAQNMAPIYHNTSEGMQVYGPVFNKTFLYTLLKLQKQIMYEVRGENNETLQDSCFMPLFPANKNCFYFSIWGYWQSNATQLEKVDDGDNYLDHFKYCSINPISPKDATNLRQSCLSDYGGPVIPSIVLGGFLKDGESIGPNPPYENSTATIITLLLNNNYDKSKTKKAYAWEKAFIDFMQKWEKEEKPDFMDVSYYASRSIEDELERTSKSEVSTIIISYLVMFLYLRSSLGSWSGSCSTLLIDSKLTLGIAGEMIVVGAVMSSYGLFGYIGVPATLIILEVIPFLVLAVGVDNIFILVQTLDRTPRLPSETRAEHIGRVVGQVAPSILLSGISESSCFFIGALSPMPAVQAFAFYAGVALILDFSMQLTCFVALLSIDVSRQDASRYDVLCCIKSSKKVEKSKEDDGILYRAVKNMYAPNLLRFPVRIIIMIIFSAWFCTSVAVWPKLTVGLDQDLALPHDSYTGKYLRSVFKYLSVGPPVYFVVKDTGFDYSDPANQEKILAGDNPLSLSGQIFSASKASNQTLIAKPTSSWIDDYMDWAKNPGCCKRNKTSGGYCPNSVSDYSLCQSCGINLVDDKLSTEDFNKYVSWFLKDNPSADCPKGGHASYAQGVNFVANRTGFVSVGASNFMTYHKVLRNSADFTNALREARKLAENITNALNEGTNSTRHQVFPYSFFYVFYEQYLTMWTDTIRSLGISVSAIFVVTFLMTGFNLRESVIILAVIIMIVTNLGGMCYFWGISLNAISLVNMVVGVGIAVEFCTHISHAFMHSRKTTRLERSRDSLSSMGSSFSWSNFSSFE
ncbi:unnamed protein product [Allacma fusca]|uniref:SSD domain-containing protein n=1 Tax=Allacma fusca TaxID=39272 RepID=A0A8J2KRJ6_9HEXA|nr:unnamed protein product [Allacma fusca]